MTDETRLSGTRGSDIDPLDDIQVEDVYGDDYLTDEYYFGYNDEPYLWNDEIEEEDNDFPF